MKKVYICSPCRGDYENNIQRAKEFSRAAVECGCIPVTPHIYLTQFMDDTIPAERELGLSIGRELVLMCDELAGPPWSAAASLSPRTSTSRSSWTTPSRLSASWA